LLVLVLAVEGSGEKLMGKARFSEQQPGMANYAAGLRQKGLQVCEDRKTKTVEQSKKEGIDKEGQSIERSI
jgi:hypothetical protein